MNINAYGSSVVELSRSPSSNVANANRSSTAQLSPKHAPTEDTISLASGVSSVQVLTDAAFDTSSRADKIASLQQAVRSGAYTVDPTNLAMALLNADV